MFSSCELSHRLSVPRQACLCPRCTMRPHSLLNLPRAHADSFQAARLTAWNSAAIACRVVDDLGTALEVYGGLAITPNLKRLAAKGTQMRSAFVSIAVCAPSRTAFLTGLRPDTTQVWTIGPYFRATSRGEGMEVVTLPQMFRMHGYNTTGAGTTRPFNRSLSCNAAAPF